MPLISRKANSPLKKTAMSNILINLATKDDAGLIANIRCNAILSQPADIWSKDELKRAADAFDERYLLKEIELGQPFYIFNNLTSSLGFVSWRDDYLAYLFVAPEGQNMGLGGKMLKFAEERIKAAKHDKVWLWSHPYPEKFYERHGYIKQPSTYAPFGLPLNKFEKQL